MVKSKLGSVDYENTETKLYQHGGKLVRKVSIKKGKGYTPFLISNAHFEMRFINNSY